jgi:cysteinyl-tRNA synthetase
MTPICRGFGGRRRDDVDSSRLPPGHYYERGFPGPVGRAKQVTYVQNITDVDDKIMRRTREEHPRNRRFVDADRIRDQLAAHGVILENSPTGVRWRPSTR